MRLARNSDQQWTTSVGGLKSLTQTATHLRQGESLFQWHTSSQEALGCHCACPSALAE
jgi:hypothetical protein